MGGMHQNERYPSGRRRAPLGVREGGSAYRRIHEGLAEAALRLLAHHGYSAMNMDEVAQVAGVSKRTVYRHYPTKVELAVAAIVRLGGMFEFEQAAAGAGERLQAFFGSEDQRDELFGPVVATAVVNRTEVPELLAALREHVLEPREALIARFIVEGQRRGEIRPDISPAAVAALSTGMHIDDLTGMHQWFGRRRASGQVFAEIWPLIAAQ